MQKWRWVQGCPRTEMGLEGRVSQRGPSRGLGGVVPVCPAPGSGGWLPLEPLASVSATPVPHPLSRCLLPARLARSFSKKLKFLSCPFPSVLAAFPAFSGAYCGTGCPVPSPRGSWDPARATPSHSVPPAFIQQCFLGVPQGLRPWLVCRALCCCLPRANSGARSMVGIRRDEPLTPPSCTCLSFSIWLSSGNAYLLPVHRDAREIWESGVGGWSPEGLGV